MMYILYRRETGRVYLLPVFLLLIRHHKLPFIIFAHLVSDLAATHELNSTR